ncbi:hypothetical protein Ahae11616_12910 [Acinetobacter haemolyticus]|uniref:Uncharacterized protein n=1 Tax=Acinetobacter haemolyticus TaxID=29430 RepID=A0A372ML59_ACIHA|nr:hypothetical protein DX910_01750 [Acinetobacter haemolyticus]QDJ93187.1 hypothetical protein AhaeAN54_014610 [Acinetobacter haemolyticus]QHI10969.1 hypothetical protein AhaeAN59_13250 [Acinetobacter haemolyticus]QHI14241.1 hypothetical protein AhaeAN43_13170 [Acinetobacter haemolyticus]QHI15821.1 hypothetical protein AhaeAN4_03895 [Acinetobacter haemolyticus]
MRIKLAIKIRHKTTMTSSVFEISNCTTINKNLLIRQIKKTSNICLNEYRKINFNQTDFSAYC